MCKGINPYQNSIVVPRYYLNMMDPEIELKEEFKSYKSNTRPTESGKAVANNS